MKAEQPPSRRWWIVLLLLGAVAFFLANYLGGQWLRGRVKRTAALPAATTPAPSISPTPVPAPTPVTADAAPAPGVTHSPLFLRIEALLTRLLAGVATAADLAQLRRELTEADPRAAIGAMREFLKTGRDANTGLELEVGAGGALAGAPTLRVFLLDLLGSIARTAGSPEAGIVSRALLDTKTTADEWALALRNVAWREPSSGAFLAGKFREMLEHEPWQAQPSAGLLEAFDVAVYARDPTLIPELAALAGGDRPPLQRAAVVALDRLAETAPLEVMNYLNSNPAVLRESPFLRADYFAKADLAQPPQRAALEQYLSRPDLAAPEKTKLLEALATPASFIADALLTQPSPAPDDTARRTAITATTAEWLRSGRFPELRPAILELQQRASGQ